MTTTSPFTTSSPPPSPPAELAASAVLAADAIADLLADPAALMAGGAQAGLSAETWRQSLGHGALGTALLHIERAAHGRSSWDTVHTWLTTAMSGPITAGADSHPHYGAPALAHVLACAADAKPGIYAPTRFVVEMRVSNDLRQQLRDAQQRLETGRPPQLSEYDAIRGLTGFAAQLLHREPDSAELRAVLGYLVKLTTPIRIDGRPVPGWWAATGPSGRPDARYPHGHANNGMAHGIAGPLAILATAARRDVCVPGQHDAIHTITTWLSHRQPTDRLTWPAVITLPEVSGPPRPSRPLRPSWCYGAAGMARAQHLAGIVLGDSTLQHTAEETLLAVLDHSRDLAQMTDPGLCHGYAGLLHASTRIAADTPPLIAADIEKLTRPLISAITGSHPSDEATWAAALLQSPQVGAGLLDGAAGIALALYAYADPTRTGWPTFMALG